MKLKMHLTFKLNMGLLTIVLIPLCLLGQEEEEETLAVPIIDSVVVHADIYRDAALVKRRGTANLSPGENRLSFAHLPNRLLPNSIQLSLAENVPVVLEDLYFEIQKIKSEPPELESMDLAIKEKETLIDSLNKQIALIEHEIKFARNLSRYFAEHYVRDKESAATNVQQAEETWSFVEKTVSEANRNKAEIKGLLDQLTSELKDLKEEREEAFSKLKQKRGLVVIVLQSSQSLQVELFFSYLLPGCRWYPAYEMHANMQERSLNLGYFAFVQQNSYENWNNITLALYTSNAQQVGNIPSLHPIYLNPIYQENRRMRALASKAEYVLTDSEMRSATAEPAPPEAEIQRSMTSFQAIVPGTVNIPPEYKKVKLPVLNKNLEVTFWTEFVPAIQNKGYLIAEMINELELPILPGRSLVFIDDKLTAQVDLEFYQPDDTMELSLGIDEQMKIKRKIGKQLEVQSGLIDKTTTLRRQYFTDITSFHLKEHTIKIREQYPVSQNEKIEVKRIVPKGKDAQFEDDTGIFVRSLEINPKENKTLETRFEVSFPRDWNIPQDF